ncbi:MAG: branched-chain amino acid ABC transporter permease [Betaproteobacteria bacterium]|nr:branched-chain amino acid ABC transporter permease [Betaproteobacteria bacterium]
MNGQTPQHALAHRALGTRVFYAAPLLALVIPLFANPYTQFIVNLTLVYVLVTVGFNLVLGNLGQLAFANTALFGIGAYTAAILMAHAGWPFWAAIPPAGAAGAAAGFLASVTALRGIRNYYLAIVTLAFGELLRWSYIHGEALSGGTDGLTVRHADFFGIALESETARFYVFLLIVTVIVKAVSNLMRSKIGRAIVAIRDNELATASLAIPTGRYIVLAFTLSGFVVGIAGSLFAVLIGQVIPESFGLIELILHFAMVLVGGLGSLFGSVLGALALTALPEFFRPFPGLYEMFFGGLLIVFLLIQPRGLSALCAKRWPALRDRYYRER